MIKMLSFVGHHVSGSMKQITAGPSGVFAILSNDNRIHYLEKLTWSGKPFYGPNNQPYVD